MQRMSEVWPKFVVRGFLVTQRRAAPVCWFIMPLSARNPRPPRTSSTAAPTGTLPPPPPSEDGYHAWLRRATSHRGTASPHESFHETDIPGNRTDHLASSLHVAVCAPGRAPRTRETSELLVSAPP
jgi:hypothetical protein